MTSLLLLSLALVNIPAYVVLGRLLFKTWDRFLGAVRLWLSFEVILSPWGATSEDFAADSKLCAFLAGSTLIVMTEYLLLSTLVFGSTI